MSKKLRINVMQDAYIAAHQAALDEFEDELRRAHALLTGPSTSLPLVLTIMIAKEYTEWGRLITGVSEVAYKENWSIPTLSGMCPRPLMPTIGKPQNVGM